MIDTHTHLYLGEEFGCDAETVVERALNVGVWHLVFPNVDVSTVEPMIKLHSKFPDSTSVAMGLHPTEITDNWQTDLDLIRKSMSAERIVAIGEVGIDLYWDSTYRNEQMRALDFQFHIAEEQNLPVIIHCREGLDEVLEVMRYYEGKLPQCVFHSFTGCVKDVEKIRELGDFYFGINGVVTFKNANSLREAVLQIGLNRLMLETDSPYLAPVPFRGKRNESANLPIVAGKIAEVLGVTVNEVEQVTDTNAIRFFNLRQDN